MESLYSALTLLAENRHSQRKFSESDIVSEEELQSILSIASRAPFASGRSSWKIAVIKDRQQIRSLAAQVRESAAALASEMEEDAGNFFRRYSASFTFFENAPLLLVPYCRETATMRSMLRDNASEEILLWEHDNLTKSLSCVSMMILLAAESLSLGACYMTGPLLAGKQLNGILGLRDNMILGAIIPVGHKSL